MLHESFLGGILVSKTSYTFKIPEIKVSSTCRRLQFLEIPPAKDLLAVWNEMTD